ncbi:phytoene desaturase [Paenibacillus frigoriresistens]|uniref:phytoene desaturase family protein n=1 Tax=Paenibacillus alginolyticus TaxID=59839 RepID=UPI0015677C4F|nr:phytoene desaturase family protein [Paenibacillus frigoriresistens]NRF91957.1 phytoene desaturase [Paenibacillus frigoriresistens]
MEVAFVGGGIGSLTAALLLSKQGKKVTIYERNTRLGGRLAYQEGGGYRIDQGPTIVLLPEMLLSILEEAGIERSRIPLLECDPLYRIHYADGTVFHKWRNKRRQIKELQRLFPEEVEGFQTYMEDMEKAFVQGKEAFLEKPFLRKREFYTLRNISLLTKLKAYKSVRSFAGRYFRNEKLLDAFSLQTLYIGGAPFQSPGLYTLLPYAEHAFGVWYVKGGYAGLVTILEEELRRRHILIRTETSIEGLVMDAGRCVGVKVADGGEYRHEAVVFNGDFPHLTKLLPKDTVPQKAYKPSSGTILIYLGLKKQWVQAAVHQFFLPQELTHGLKDIFMKNKLPKDPSFYIFYPTAIDPDAAPPGESVMYMLLPSPPHGSVTWEDELPALVDHVIDEAEKRGFPGLRAAIQWKEVRSPKDAESEGLYQGGSFGIAPTFGQSAVFRPQIVPYPIEGLYAVGASVHPGGGIPIVMQGAKLLANHLLKE